MSACRERLAVLALTAIAGACSVDAPPLSACDAGCAAVETCCEGICTTLSTDSYNCGVCDNVCPVDCCDGQCVDTASDPANCGSCGDNCGSGIACCSDACTDLASDIGNCGACGTPCPEGKSCKSGSCG